MFINTLIKMKNAQYIGKKSMKIPYAKMDYAILEELKRYGFVKKIEIKGRPPKRILEVVFGKERNMQGLKIISKPSVRRYSGYEDFKAVKGGRGLLIVSTSKGIMSGVRARKEKVGGQLLFEIW